MKRRAYLQYGVFFLFCVMLAFAVFKHGAPQYAEAATIGQGIKSFQELSDRFAALANKKGAVYAYEVLREAPLPPGTDLHLLGHTVGDILYKQKGVAGIA